MYDSRVLNKLNTYPFLQRTIRNWLKAGLVDNGVFEDTKAGTPQGGVLSPLLANIALHGMENHIKKSFPRTKELGEPGKRKQVLWQPQVIRYADDFVIIHQDKSVIEICQKLVKEWLERIGLKLNEKKTRIAHTLNQEDGKSGFDFLGFNVRQYKVSKYNSKQGFKTLIKPGKAEIKRHYRKLSNLIDQNKASSQEALIGQLNPVIIGWCRYYSTTVSKRIFQKLDQMLYEKLKRWAKRRHPRKPIRWTMNKYWHIEEKGWEFKAKTGVRLLLHTNMSITRHIKVKGKASPFDGIWSYWATRRGKYPGTSNRMAKLMKKQKGRCEQCKLYFTSESLIEIHHIDRNRKNNNFTNLTLLHRHCHDRAHGKGEEISRQEGTHDKS